LIGREQILIQQVQGRMNAENEEDEKNGGNEKKQGPGEVVVAKPRVAGLAQDSVRYAALSAEGLRRESLPDRIRREGASESLV
jgi:hypothetical protein